jgi:hypothetical protein
MTIRDAINSALDEEMERDPSVFIIGACPPLATPLERFFSLTPLSPSPQ